MAEIKMKYILTDDYNPLYALAKIHGPRTGPIRTPIRVPIEVLKELLYQKNPCRFYEVIEIARRKNDNVPIWSDKVKLTISNYTTSWYDLAKEQGITIPDKITTELNLIDKMEELEETIEEELPDEETVGNNLVNPALNAEVSEFKTMNDDIKDITAEINQNSYLEESISSMENTEDDDEEEVDTDGENTEDDEEEVDTDGENTEDDEEEVDTGETSDDENTEAKPTNDVINQKKKKRRNKNK